MQDLNFWYDCIGRHLAPDTAPAASTKAGVMTRLKKGVASNPLGAGIDVFYIANKKKSFVVGKLEAPKNSNPVIEFFPSEEVSGEKFIAQWLVNDAPEDEPWMIGVIGNANPNSGMKISRPLALCRFCDMSSGFDFDLGIVRNAVKIIGDDLDWKKDVAPALHIFQSRLQASGIGDEDKVERENKKLQKAFDKSPTLKKALLALCRLPLKPNSGEYEILSRLNRIR